MKIVLSKRFYNGDCGVGSVFESSLQLEINDDILTLLKYHKKYCVSEIAKEDMATKFANVNMEVEYCFSQNSINKIKIFVNTIQNNSDYVWNETHYSKTKFDFKRTSYFDITIDGNEYELLNENPLLEELLELVSYNDFDATQIISNYEMLYNEKINNGQKITDEERNKLKEKFKNSIFRMPTEEYYREIIEEIN